MPLDQDTLKQLQEFFTSKFEAKDIMPMRKPHYSDSPPIWKDKIMLISDNIQYYTEVRAWIKAPSQRFPTATAMVSFVNAKYSVFVRLHGVEELKTIAAAMTNWIPIIEAKLAELKPLEIQYQAAKQVYDQMLAQKQIQDLQSLSNNHHEDE